LNSSSLQLVLEKIGPTESNDLVVRDAKSGFVFFNVEGHLYEYDAAARTLKIEGGRLMMSPEFAAKAGRPADAGVKMGEISIDANVIPIQVTTLVNGAARATSLPAGSDPAGALAAGPDIITGDLDQLQQVSGSTVGTQVALTCAPTSCNKGDTPIDFFQLPNVDHPVIMQSLYRVSGGASNTERFEQIGEGWAKHAFGADQFEVCSANCQPYPDQTKLGQNCSDTYAASTGALFTQLGSRAWINPFTGAFPSTANSHTGHTHNGVAHRLTVEMADLNTSLNAGATYYAEVQYVAPHEYTWCQSHPGQCNMYNNASYRRFNVTGTTSFTFNSTGTSTVRMSPAINGWPGATVVPIEPAPGVDGRAFIAYKVSGPTAGVWHYEYVIYNQNLDRAVQSFSVPLGCTQASVSNIGSGQRWHSRQCWLQQRPLDVRPNRQRCDLEHRNVRPKPERECSSVVHFLYFPLRCEPAAAGCQCDGRVFQNRNADDGADSSSVSRSDLLTPDAYANRDAHTGHHGNTDSKCDPFAHSGSVAHANPNRDPNARRASPEPFDAPQRSDR
jgi:hypothetical protein